MMCTWPPEAAMLAASPAHPPSPAARESAGVGVATERRVSSPAHFFPVPPEIQTLDLIFDRHRQLMKPRGNILAGKMSLKASMSVCFESDFSLTALQSRLAFKHSGPPPF